MNQTIPNETAKLIEDIRSALEIGGRFLLEQAPPLAREVVVFARVYQTITCVFGLILILALVYRLLVWLPKSIGNPAYYNEDGDPRARLVLPIIVNGVLGLFGTMTLTDHLRSCILAWFAPRAYLLEYLRQLV